MEKDVIYSSISCFTSVREPFILDNFVKRIFTQVIPAEQARRRYAAFLKDRPFLPALLREIGRDAQGTGTVDVVDCGVFMGNFAIAVDIQAEAEEIPVSITAYEANSALVEPIKANFLMYGVDGAVFDCGIGARHGMVEFVHLPEGMIGGTLHAPETKVQDSKDYITTQCEIVPLQDVLADAMAPGLVKMDIEGNEAAAFSSIARDTARLNNVFIVEYAPFQGEIEIDGGTYNEFLLRHFRVFDINNWLWFPSVRSLTSIAALERVMEGHASRPVNTDLLLIPHDMTSLIDWIVSHEKPSAT